MLKSGKLNITMDGQFGSTGKGLLNSYVALNSDIPIDVCISNAAPNAGHTYVDPDTGEKRTTFHLPVSGVLCPDSLIYLCAGAIIDPEILDKEIKDFNIDPDRVFIHPRACIVLPEHRQREAGADTGATSIASTRKGVGASLSDKIARTKGDRVAEQYYAGRSHPYNVFSLDLSVMMEDGQTLLMEVPQGFSLSLNHGRSYPTCTSRDLTVAQALNDAGVHPIWLGSVIVSLRTYPIRVGNIMDKDGNEIGNSGPFYNDSTEISFEDLGQEKELTTVTKRVRRIATFSFEEYARMLRMLRPDCVFLNFCNYIHNKDAYVELISQMEEIESDEEIYPPLIIGAGPSARDVQPSCGPDGDWAFIEERKVGDQLPFEFGEK